MVFAALELVVELEGLAKMKEMVREKGVVVEEIAFEAGRKLGHCLALPRPHMRSYKRKFYHSNMNSIHFLQVRTLLLNTQNRK
jgi:hypothetical protein